MTNNQPIDRLRLGATPLPSGGCRFVVWAPDRNSVDVCLSGEPKRVLPMKADVHGYYSVVVEQVEPGATYLYRLDQSVERPDPASRLQPEDVHGPSQVVDLAVFRWTDFGWKGPGLEDSVFYELHVGTFTPEGTFAAIIPQLDRLAEIGVTTIELMPIGQFPGERNWGYDGVYPYAVQNSYGSPRDLQALVNAAHARGLAVALDVVYNHLGPEGNYLGEYGPYFTNRYRTPWGLALNFDGPQSDEVRRFFTENAISWLEDFHFDALRLDAVHSICDSSAYPFLAELADAVKSLSARSNRKLHLIAESDLNDARVLRPTTDGGYGMDSQWSDDFHHSVHTLLTGENSGYYADFGEVKHLARTWEHGWFYAGQYSRHRKRKHGNQSPRSERSHFVVCNQNHDQTGNRALGDRLGHLVDFEGLKLAAGATLLSSFVPLLFMGEEYGETARFLYFTSHGDPQLAEAVREGRRKEFEDFEGSGEVPDPQSKSTFEASKLNYLLAGQEPHRTLLRFYQMLLRFRRERELARTNKLSVTEDNAMRALTVMQKTPKIELTLVLHFGNVVGTLHLQLPAGPWEKRIDSADALWAGPGATTVGKLDANGALQVKMAPHSFVVFERSSSSSLG